MAAQTQALPKQTQAAALRKNARGASSLDLDSIVSSEFEEARTGYLLCRGSPRSADSSFHAAFPKAAWKTKDLKHSLQRLCNVKASLASARRWHFTPVCHHCVAPAVL